MQKDESNSPHWSRNDQDGQMHLQETSEEVLKARTAQGLYLLQQWLLGLHQHKMADCDDEGMYRVKPEVSARFAIGLSFANNYIVMPDLEANWASMLPWEYAAMRENDSTLYLILADIEIDGMSTTDFGMSFVIPDPIKANLLRIKKTLQLRRYVTTERKTTISQDWFASMPIEILKPFEGHFEKKSRKHKFSAKRNK